MDSLVSRFGRSYSPYEAELKKSLVTSTKPSSSDQQPCYVSQVYEIDCINCTNFFDEHFSDAKEEMVSEILKLLARKNPEFDYQFSSLEYYTLSKNLIFFQGCQLF